MHLLTQSALLRALGWSLLNSLWQMAFLWLVYVCFVNIFRRTSAHLRHGLAILLLGAGTVWTGISFFNAFFSADPLTPASRLGVSSFWGSDRIASFLVAGRQLIIEGLPYCSTLYLLTLCMLFARFGKQYFYSRRLAHAGLSKAAPELRTFVEQTGRRMGIKKVVKVWLSSLVEGPVTLGSLKPIILLPLAMVSHLSPEQMEALILHELAHIRRQDYLLHLWIAFLEILFFFNPFSRLLIRSIQKEREHRCDDLVLQFRYDPHTYVSALLALAKGIQGSPRLVLAATGGDDQLLLQRVRRILKLNQTSEPLRGKPLIFLFLTLFTTGMLLSWPNFAVKQPAAFRVPAIAASEKKITDEPAGGESKRTAFVSVSFRIAHKQAALRKPATPHAHHKDAAGDEDSYATDELIQSDAPAEDEDGNALAGYASTPLQADKRDYSISAHTDVVTQLHGDGAPPPYVPNSSFSFQNIQDSTTLPGEQYVYLQQMASHQVELAINKMQKELQIQLKLLQQAGAKEAPELRQKRQILMEQLKLQQQYLDKQQELQRKLGRIGKKRVTVVI
ncbi:M56 family metallopeptidase [Flavitalea sp. BT771]|uniref:M56 family metallopeptidase n=1 Tax=Flavitalea sp. BT771 TaxID=3063329 RepID=UPI0026E1DA99|nr:M56 family metallopeptidase [Flavitalea sp. BT771]MDO6431305.1 M56 family metallopeptidase [Flavitalea sp. BT771]MDV6220213.1 M56 family metallopeptidase [Flavitalea sp. BT771]